MKLIVKKLVKKFKSTFAVDNISFEIEKNNTLGLLGPNGCGKTTSIGMMLGLITPTQGEIFIDGIQLNSKIPGLITTKLPIKPIRTAIHLRIPTFSFKSTGDKAVVIKGATKARVKALAIDIIEIE